ncbi:MAG: ECF transporter S component [Oscillospiraceae bacterium]
MIVVGFFMSFSFMGYVHIAPISLTFVYIPVMVAGCILGPKNSTIVGAVFGIASMWKASAFYVAARDAIFSPVMSEKPFASILLSVGSRALFGLIIGLLYRIAKNSRHPIAGILLVSTVGRTIHTVLVYSFMQLLFPEAGFTLINTLDDIRRWDFLPFIVIVDAIVVICYLTSRSEFVRGVLERVRNVDQVNELSSRSRIGMAVMLSLALLAIIFILMYQKNFNYLYYEARLDGLTGLMGRQQFFQAGKKILGEMKLEREDAAGCFVILDVDSFKEINDRYGHPEGDRVLREVADHLRKAVGESGILGRLGGDEFVALIRVPLTGEEIETYMSRLREAFATIRVGEQSVTCSIGVIPLEPGVYIEDLYRSADHLLYEAKKKGKNQVAFGYRYLEAGKKAEEEQEIGQ